MSMPEESNHKLIIIYLYTGFLTHHSSRIKERRIFIFVDPDHFYAVPDPLIQNKANVDPS